LKFLEHLLARVDAGQLHQKYGGSIKCYHSWHCAVDSASQHPAPFDIYVQCTRPGRHVMMFAAVPASMPGTRNWFY
jgi:hypothetical protein